MIDGKYEVVIREFGYTSSFSGKYYVARIDTESYGNDDECEYLHHDGEWHDLAGDNAVFDTYEDALHAYQNTLEVVKIMRDVNGTEIKVGMKIRCLVWIFDDNYYTIDSLEENKIFIKAPSGNIRAYPYIDETLWELESEDD